MADLPVENLGCLRVGLTLGEVRALLEGWTDHPIRGATMPGKAAYFSLWDFSPPVGSGASRVRLTFADDRLLTWGEPSEFR